MYQKNSQLTKERLFKIINVIVLILLFFSLIVVGGITLFNYTTITENAINISALKETINQQYEEFTTQLEQQKKGNKKDVYQIKERLAMSESTLKEEIETSSRELENKLSRVVNPLVNQMKETEPKSNLESSQKKNTSQVYDFQTLDTTKFSSFDQLCGMSEEKNLVKPFIEIIQGVDIAKQRGKVELPTGLMMYGIPGCGKTVFARAIAKETNLPYIEESCAIFSRGIKGESPKMVRELFTKAREEAKRSKRGCVIFLDECESIFLNIARLPAESDIRNVVNEFKVQLVPTEEDLNYPIFVIGATNNLKDIDDAILSRFTNRIELKPGNLADRKEQLKFIIEKQRKYPITKEAKEFLLNSLNLALDQLPPEQNFKKAYRVLDSLVKESNNQSIRRALEARKQNQTCHHSEHNMRHQNTEKMLENNQNKQSTSPDILGNCCPCEAISEEDLRMVYKMVIDPTLKTLL